MASIEAGSEWGGETGFMPTGYRPFGRRSNPYGRGLCSGNEGRGRISGSQEQPGGLIYGMASQNGQLGRLTAVFPSRSPSPQAWPVGVDPFCTPIDRVKPQRQRRCPCSVASEWAASAPGPRLSARGEVRKSSAQSEYHRSRSEIDIGGAQPDEDTSFCL